MNFLLFLMKLIILFLFLIPFPVSAQYPEIRVPDTLDKKLVHLPIYRQTNLTAPASMVAYGLYSLINKDLKHFDYHLKHEMMELNHNPTDTKFNNYLQYAPVEGVYGLNAMGIKGRNNFIDRSLIYGLSNLIMSQSVKNIKGLSQKLRPDGSDRRSFPSGHTATAFSAAEFMRLEYRDVSPWYGVGAYTIAGTVGALRMYDNKHWFGDVMAGAGVGILSTDLAYWAYPRLQKVVKKQMGISHEQKQHITVLPSFQEHHLMVSLTYKPKN